jgi:hypothetical protein
MLYWFKLRIVLIGGLRFGVVGSGQAIYPIVGTLWPLVMLILRNNGKQHAIRTVTGRACVTLTLQIVHRVNTVIVFQGELHATAAHAADGMAEISPLQKATVRLPDTAADLGLTAIIHMTGLERHAAHMGSRAMGTERAIATGNVIRYSMGQIMVLPKPVAVPRYVPPITRVVVDGFLPNAISQVPAWMIAVKALFAVTAVVRAPTLVVGGFMARRQATARILT